MTEQEALDAVKEGVRRARCVLVDAAFDSDNTLVICAKKAGDPINQIGREWWWLWSAEELKERTRRFCEHWCLGKPYRVNWERAGSIH